jgi:hypothetical protein
MSRARGVTSRVVPEDAVHDFRAEAYRDEEFLLFRLWTTARCSQWIHRDATSPLWFIDLERGEKKTLVRIANLTPRFAKDPNMAQEMRVDLHPAWDSRTNTLVAFNGVDQGTRHVFVADLSGLVPPA